MLRNELLVSAIFAWLAAQVLKTIIFSIQNHRLEFARLIGDGGMPSGHSATVSALATSCALCFGVSSFQFAISAVLAVIVMHDASGVRLESGKQAQAINEVVEYLRSEFFHPDFSRLKEVLGHTPSQVFFGALLGIAMALLIHSC